MINLVRASAAQKTKASKRVPNTGTTIVVSNQQLQTRLFAVIQRSSPTQVPLALLLEVFRSAAGAEKKIKIVHSFPEMEVDYLQPNNAELMLKLLTARHVTDLYSRAALNCIALEYNRMRSLFPGHVPIPADDPLGAPIQAMCKKPYMTYGELVELNILTRAIQQQTNRR